MNRCEKEGVMLPCWPLEAKAWPAFLCTRKKRQVWWRSETCMLVSSIMDIYNWQHLSRIWKLLLKATDQITNFPAPDLKQMKLQCFTWNVYPLRNPIETAKSNKWHTPWPIFLCLQDKIAGENARQFSTCWFRQDESQTNLRAIMEMSVKGWILKHTRTRTR